MLYLHETHRIAGDHADDFEAAYRDELMPALATGEDARLLWYLHQAHGTGPSYVAVTILGVRDGAAWERIARRKEEGDLHALARALDAMSREQDSKLLTPVSWSSLQALDLATVPTSPEERPASLYMEDTVWPHPGKLDDYLSLAGTLYAQETIAKRLADGTGLLDLRAAFRTVAGAHAGREVTLWQKVVRPELLQMLFTIEVPAEFRAPGTWMHDALAYRDRWESRLLRTAPWSPLD